MVCCKCKKRPAVVFVSNNKEDTEPKGYCLVCAKELGIKPVDDILKRMGISPDDLEAVQEQMDSIMENMGDMGDFSALAQSMGSQAEGPELSVEDDGKDDDEDGFTPGGAPSFPNFFNMFGNGAQKTSSGSDKRQKDNKKQKNRKHIGLYCEDLTRKARAGEIDRVVGRDKEIERVIQILSRRTKNNPCLIGEPGVGKTAIAEGLALRIAEGRVPHRLMDKEIQLLDLTALIAGTQFRGQYESRIKGLTKEVKEAGNIILFIDEVHNLVGGGDSEGTMNAANILKPALSRGEIQVIGATTFNEYRKYIEKDSALERRFQPVKVGEPSIGDTIEILQGIREYYEKHHNVEVSDDIVRKAAVFSERYITDRFLPDKAIDLMDEAAAKLRMERDSVPEELDEITRRLKQLEIEREAIRREADSVGGDSVAASKLAQLNKDIADLREQEQQMKAKWEGEKALLSKIQANKQQIEQLKFEADRAEREGDYGRVAEIRYGKLQALESEIQRIQEQLRSAQGAEAMVKEEVTADDIAEVVSRWTGIPVSKMLQSEREKLLHLEEELHKRVIGQDEAIRAVADAVRRSRAGLQDPKRPIGSFIFLGTTGVGKTELAKALAEFLFDDETMMTRIDMSEYQEKHSVSRLIGAPPGYVGYDEGGQLTEAVRRKPYSVVLFDEIEKAHPDVFNTLLQVLDDGRLTDNKGRTVNFKNTIIILTSNLGSEYIRERLAPLSHPEGDVERDATQQTLPPTGGLRGALLDEVKAHVLDMLKRTIRPEFLNRIDETIMFEPLTETEIREVVKLQVASVQKMLSQNGITLSLTDAAIDLLTREGYDPEFGARPVKRAIQRLLLNDLSKAILSGTVSRDNEIRVDADSDHLTFA